MQLWNRAGIRIAGLAAAVVATGVAASLVTATAVPADRSITSGRPVSAVSAGFPSGPGDPGIFTDRCAFSHEAPDDPILDAGMTGMSMQHDFFGNTATDASSTAASLRGGSTTCSTSADASAYWIPVMYRNGTAVTPSSSLIYWRRPANDTRSVQTVPEGLQMIAGDESATEPQGVDTVAWSCQGKGAKPQQRSATPASCPPTAHLKLTVTFPSCWDGHTLAAKDRTNVVYPGSSGCPSSHPVQIPQIVFHVLYPIAGATGLTMSMAPGMTGSTDTVHVDFINGWNEDDLTRDVRQCVATSTRCGQVTGADATAQGPNRRQLRKIMRKAAHHRQH